MSEATEDQSTMVQHRRATNNRSISSFSNDQQHLHLNGTSALLEPSSSKYHKDDDSVCSPRFWSVMTLATMSFLIVFCIQQFTDDTPALVRQQRQERSLALSQFPTVAWALDHADLVGLYFAASWCPMSTPVTEKLGECFPASDLLPPPTLDRNPSKTFAFAIVHISSDTTQEALDAYAKPNWISIPIAEEERTALKKHFAVCAKREIEGLDMERKFEIPSLFILDGPTHGVITTGGALDLINRGDAVLDYWREMQAKIRSMEQNSH
jgi:hypothetical protein